MSGSIGISIKKLIELPVGKSVRDLKAYEDKLDRDQTDRKITRIVTAILSLVGVGLSIFLLSTCGWTAASLPTVFYTAIGMDAIIAVVALSVIFKSRAATHRAEQDGAARRNILEDVAPIPYEQFVNEALSVNASSNLELFNKLSTQELLNVIQEVDRRLRRKERVGRNFLDPLSQQDLSFLSHEQVQSLSNAFHRALLDRNVLLPQLTNSDIFQVMNARETELEHCRKALSLIPQERFQGDFNYFITRLGQEHQLNDTIVKALAAYPAQILAAFMPLRSALNEKYELAIAFLNYLPQSLINEERGGEYLYSDLIKDLLLLSHPDEQADKIVIAKHPLGVASMMMFERGEGIYTQQIESIFNHMSFNNRRRFTLSISAHLVAFMQGAECNRGQAEKLFNALSPVLDRSAGNVSVELLRLFEDNLAHRPEGRGNLIQRLYENIDRPAKNAFVARLFEKFTAHLDQEVKENRGWFERAATARIRILKEEISKLPQIEPIFKAIGKEHEVIARIICESEGSFIETPVAKMISAYMDEEDVDEVIRLLPTYAGYLSDPEEVPQKMGLDILKKCYQDQIDHSGAIAYLLNHPQLLWASFEEGEEEIPSSFILKILEKGGERSQEAIRDLNEQEYQKLLEELRASIDSPSETKARFAFRFLNHHAYPTVKNRLGHHNWTQFESELARLIA